MDQPEISASAWARRPDRFSKSGGGSNDVHSAFVVLVVDDEPDVLESVGFLLEEVRPNVQVLTAGAGEPALELLKRQHVDLLLVDYHMSPMNGVELIQEARRIQPDLPVIMASGDPDTASDAAREEELALIRFLPKPFAPSQLLVMIQGQTGSPAA